MGTEAVDHDQDSQHISRADRDDLLGLFTARPALKSRCMSRICIQMLVRAKRGVNQRVCVMKERADQDK